MSNWLLYIGIFLCCSGFGVAPGAILIFMWGIGQITDKKETGTTVNNYYASSSEIDNDLVIDEWKTQVFPKRQDCKKDAFSDDTKEGMR